MLSRSRISVSKILGKKDDLIREEEIASNDYIYDKLRHDASLKVYGLAKFSKIHGYKSEKTSIVNFSQSEALTGKVFHGLKQFRFYCIISIGDRAIFSYIRSTNACINDRCCPLNVKNHCPG